MREKLRAAGGEEAVRLFDEAQDIRTAMVEQIGEIVDGAINEARDDKLTTIAIAEALSFLLARVSIDAFARTRGADAVADNFGEICIVALKSLTANLNREQVTFEARQGGVGDAIMGAFHKMKGAK